MKIRRSSTHRTHRRGFHAPPNERDRRDQQIPVVRGDASRGLSSIPPPRHRSPSEGRPTPPKPVRGSEHPTTPIQQDPPRVPSGRDQQQIRLVAQKQVRQTPTRLNHLANTPPTVGVVEGSAPRQILVTLPASARLRPQVAGLPHQVGSTRHILLYGQIRQSRQ